jgi:hypothetical protein
MTEALKKIMREKDADGLTNREKVMQALLLAATEGNIAAIKEINERLDGKVEQREEVTGKDGGPLVVTLADIARRVMAEEAEGND